MLEFILFQWIQAFNSYKPSHIHTSLCDGLTFSVDTTQEAKGLQKKKNVKWICAFEQLWDSQAPAVTVFPHWVSCHPCEQHLGQAALWLPKWSTTGSREGIQAHRTVSQCSTRVQPKSPLFVFLDYCLCYCKSCQIHVTTYTVTEVLTVQNCSALPEAK